MNVGPAIIGMIAVKLVKKTLVMVEHAQIVKVFVIVESASVVRDITDRTGYGVPLLIRAKRYLHLHLHPVLHGPVVADPVLISVADYVGVVL